jgi:hypothetical protein
MWRQLAADLENDLRVAVKRDCAGVSPPAVTVEECCDVPTKAGQPVAGERLTPDREAVSEPQLPVPRIDEDDPGRLERPQRICARSAQDVGTAPTLRRGDPDPGGDRHDQPAREQLDVDPERPIGLPQAWESRDRCAPRHEPGHRRERERGSGSDRARTLVGAKLRRMLCVAPAAAGRRGQHDRENEWREARDDARDDARRRRERT